MKRHTSIEWCEFFGIEMIDDDGWRDKGQSFTDNENKFTLPEFMERLSVSTIEYSQYEMFRRRRSVLDFIA